MKIEIILGYCWVVIGVLAAFAEQTIAVWGAIVCSQIWFAVDDVLSGALK